MIVEVFEKKKGRRCLMYKCLLRSRSYSQYGCLESQTSLLVLSMICKVKLLLKSMPTPTLALDKLLKIAEYPHSEDHNVFLSLVQ